MIRKGIQAVVGYLLFALGVAGVCVWYGFPYTAAVNTRLAARVSPRVKLVVREAGPLFPLGIAAPSMEISCPGMRGNPGFPLHDVNVRASLFSLVVGKWNISFDAGALGGSLHGRGIMTPRRIPVNLDGSVEVDGVGIKGFSPCLKGFEGLTGTLDGTAFFTGSLHAFPQGRGNATFALKKVAGVLRSPLVVGFTVKDGSGDARVRMEKGRIDILSCTFESTGLKGDLKGRIMLRTPLGKSTLHLVLALTADEAIKEQPGSVTLLLRPGVTRRVIFSGTMEDPRATFQS